MKKTYQEIIKKCLKEKPKTEKELAKVKRWAAKKFNILPPSNMVLNKVYQELLKNKTIKRNKSLEKLLIKRKVRSLSGVVVVSVLTKPFPCPGKCIYCPKEKGIPKSYLSGEPAVERAKALKYNPYLQVQKRIEMLKMQGHPTDKIELRVIGGSFSAYPKNYKIWFIKECFRAVNEIENPKYKPQKSKSKIEDLIKEQKINEKAKNKIVGISVETRPDLITKEEIILIRTLGITMVEIGVQTIFNEILKKCKRGHTTEEIKTATKLLKDAGFKVMYHLMPNLPGSSPKLDEKMFKEVFENQNYRPDWLKIIPVFQQKKQKFTSSKKKKNGNLIQTKPSSIFW